MAFGGFGAVGFGAAAGGFGAPAAQAAPAADAVDKDVQLQLAPNTDTISSIAWSPTSQFVAISEWGGKVSVYEVSKGPDGSVAAGNPKLLSNDLGAPLLDLKWTPDGTGICAVGCNQKATLWNLGTNQYQDIGTHDGPIKCVNWCPTLNCYVTGGWDSTLRYLDPRTPREVERVSLPSKLHTVDVKEDAMVLGTADKKLHIFSLANPKNPLRTIDSPLKLNTRCIRIMHDKQFFLASSPEGRCAIRCLDGNMDQAKIPGSDKTYSFAFKCHRASDLIYPVNALDAHPLREFHTVFSTAGSDGVVSFWDREKRQRLREMKVTSLPGPASAGVPVPVTDSRWSPDGTVFAYAMGYDWSKGGEYHDPVKMPPSLWLHTVIPDKDLRKKA